MKYVSSALLLFFIWFDLLGQNQEGISEGSVSYVTSQSVYVKFISTANMQAGDTLFISREGNLFPALIIKDLSSMSCVCIPLSGMTFRISDKVIYRTTRVKAVQPSEPAPPVQPVPQPAPVPPPATETQVQQGQPTTAGVPDTTTLQIQQEKKTRQQIHGAINITSYTNWSNDTNTSTSQREKLTFSFLGRNLGNTNLSAECYISYYINPKQYNEVQNSITNQLKIYNFNLSYDFGKKATLLLGRKINPKLSSMGPNDGLQFEWKFKPVSIGVIAGFRPDWADFGFNASLFQAGAYLFNEYAGKHGFMQSTLAFINQTNSGKTDRRFFYIQHSNSLIKNLAFFGSVEFDIYGKTFNSIDSTYSSNSSPRLTNLYLSLSYRILRRLSLSFSYNNRQNVIYYESYKTFLDRLLDTQTLQGYSLQVNYNPVNKLSLGVNAAYRFMNQDPKPTSNIYVYVGYSQIPGINAGATASVIFLGTGYVKGRIYSAGLSKDIAKGKLYMGLTYRYVDYHYFNTEFTPTLQNMGEFSLTWRIIKKLALSVYYEGTFEKVNRFNRIYAQVNWGF